MTLRETIARKRRMQLAAISYGAAMLGTLSGLVIAGLLAWQWWLALLIWLALVLTGNVRLFISTTRALRIYDSSPAAAYIAEVQHAFGIKS